MMNHFAKKRTEWLGMLLIVFLCIIFVNPGYAASDKKGANNPNEAIKITYPEKNSVISGYFLPVSWRDPGVEGTKIAYPENYQQSNATYQITLSDKSQNIVLKGTATGQNYFVFHYDEIKGLFSSDTAYFIMIEETDRLISSRAVRFFYQEPVEGEAENQIAASESLAEAESLSLTSTAFTSISCPYCLTDNWSGLLVLLLSPTTYDKNITVDCNQVNWVSTSFASTFSGPFFISINSGNFKIAYNDSIVYASRCIDIYPWAYTVVQFP